VIDVFIPCVPPKTSHHHKKIGFRFGPGGVKHPTLVDRKELHQSRGDWLSLLMPHAPAAPLEAPVLLDLEFTWPWRNSDTKRDRLLGRIPCIVKPDADNMAKTITDVLVMAGYVAHDAEIADLRVTKWIGDRPGLRLQMRTIERGRGARSAISESPSLFGGSSAASDQTEDRSL
jgi:Holliday junction resolvase RusA-like endonuclease